MSEEHTPRSTGTEDRFRVLAHSMPPSDFGSTRAIQAAAKLADELVAETAAERDRLREEVARLQAELRVAYKLPLAMGHPVAVELEAIAAEKAELVAVLKAFLSYLEGQCDCEESSGCHAAKLRSQARAALTKATATEGDAR